MRFGASSARVVLSGRDADGPHELAVGFVPGELKRLTRDGAPFERLSTSRIARSQPSSRRIASSSSRDSPACAVPTSTSSSRRSGPRAPRRGAPTTRRSRSATRCLLASARGAVKRRTGKLEPRARGSRHCPCGRPSRRRRPASRRASHGAPPSSASWARSAELSPAIEGESGKSLRRSSSNASMRTSPAATQRTVPTATTCCSLVTGATCAHSGRRASSGWRCSRCCWQSATPWPPSARARR